MGARPPPWMQVRMGQCWWRHCWDVLGEAVPSLSESSGRQDRAGVSLIIQISERSSVEKNQFVGVGYLDHFLLSCATGGEINFCFPKDKPMSLRFGFGHPAAMGETRTCTLHDEG